MNSNILLDGTSKRIISNKKQSQADLLKNSRMFQNKVKEYLSYEFETELDDGTKVDLPLVDLLVAKRIGYLIDNPKDIDMKEISTVLGENKVEQEITVRGADALFGDLVIKEDN